MTLPKDRKLKTQEIESIRRAVDEASDMEDFLDECQSKADELNINLEYYLEEFI